MKSKIVRFMVCVVSLVFVWGIGSTCFADNAAEVVIQVSYPNGNGWAAFYNGAVGDINDFDTEKDYWVDVHVTLLDADGDPATAGPAGETLATLTATLTTSLGLTNSIVEDSFLSDTATLTFDVTDVGPAARAHVKYACTTSCVPGDDTLEVTVGTLDSASVDVEIRAPKAASLVLRTPGASSITPTSLFAAMPAQVMNGGVGEQAGQAVSFNVLARESKGSEFTFAPELDGQEVTVSAWADYNASNTVRDNAYEMSPLTTATATFSGGSATGEITINAAGTQDSAGNSQLKVVLTATSGSGTARVRTTEGTIVATDTTVDWVGMKPKAASKLVIGKDTLGVRNLITEVNDWFVLDDNSSPPTTNAIAVFVTDDLGNPVTGSTVTISASISGPLVTAAKTLVDASGALTTTATAHSAWNISGTIKDNNNQGLATLRFPTAGIGDLTSQENWGNKQEASGTASSTAGTQKGKPLEATLKLDANIALTSDTTTVWLVRWDATAPQNLDLRLLADKPQSSITAGATVTLYINDASATSKSYPTTSEIVEGGDNLIIDAFECDNSTTLMISKSTDSFANATSEGLSYKAPTANGTTKHIAVPIKIYGACSSTATNSICLRISDTDKGIENIPLYDTAVHAIADCNPATASQIWFSSLASGVKAQNGDLKSDPVIITSAFEVGVPKGLFSAASVDKADAYENITDDTPGYNVDNDMGSAQTTSRVTTVLFDDDAVGETATITVNMMGTSLPDRELKITNIVESGGVIGKLECETEGPAVGTPGGEVIVQVKSSKTFTTTPRSIKVDMDTDNSVTGSEIRDFSGTAFTLPTTQSLASGSAVRLVVSAPEAGNVVIEANDASGNTQLLETGSCTIKFATDLEDPTASVDPCDETVPDDTEDIVITVNDDIGVDLGDTTYTIEMDSTDVTGDLDCVNADDGTTKGTITCSKTGGLDLGAYTVTVTPQDLVGKVGTEVTCAFTVSTCDPAVEISPDGASLQVGKTQQFSAESTCDDVPVTGTYTWEIMAGGCTGSSINSTGLYTAPSSSSSNCTDTVKVTDTANGNVTDTATVTVSICTVDVTITPSSATVKINETQQFSASTDCDGTVTGTYVWSVSGSAGGSIDASSGLYTAGSTGGTDTVTVTDTANGSATATATVTVTTVSCTVSPDPMIRSNWIWLPVIPWVTITGDGTSFAIFSTTVSYSPTGALIALPPLILGAEAIWQSAIVNPAWLAGVTADETVTATVTTGSEEVECDFEITLLDFLSLDE